MEFELDEFIILLLRWLRLELLTFLLRDLEDLERLDPSQSLLRRSESLDYLLPEPKLFLGYGGKYTFRIWIDKEAFIYYPLQ